MPDHKTLLGLLTLAIGVVSYSFYFRSIFRGKTRPDPYSWLIWGVLATITFFAQNADGGGAGAWATALTAIMCYLISFVTYRRHTGTLKPIDIASLIGAGVGVVLWYFTKDPLWTVCIAVAIGVIGFVPTFVKTLSYPTEEPAVTFLLNACKFGIALLALGQFTPVTALYPAALVVMNVGLAATILVKREEQSSAH